MIMQDKLSQMEGLNLSERDFKMNVWKDEQTGLYTVDIENGNFYECLSEDELQEVIRQEFERGFEK